jgi:hypothetical protein
MSSYGSYEKAVSRAVAPPRPRCRDLAARHQHNYLRPVLVAAFGNGWTTPASAAESSPAFSSWRRCSTAPRSHLGQKRTG